MQAMAMTAKRILTSVAKKSCARRFGLRPRSRPEMTAAMKHAEPVAESQLRSNFAGSATILATTGGLRRTALWREGALQPPSWNAGVVTVLMASLIVGRPQRRTKMERMTKGIHARKI